MFHARRGARVEAGQIFATVYATTPEMLREPIEILKQAIKFSQAAPEPVPLVGRIFTRESAEQYMKAVERS